MSRWRAKQIWAAAAMDFATGWPLGAAILCARVAAQITLFLRQMEQQQQRMEQWGTLPEGFLFNLNASNWDGIYRWSFGALLVFLMLRKLWRSVGSKAQRQFWGRLPLCPMQKAAAATWANFAWLLVFWALQLASVLGCWALYASQMPLQQYSELTWAFLQSSLLRQWFPLVCPVQLLAVVLSLVVLSLAAAGLERGTRGRTALFDLLDCGCGVCLLAVLWGIGWISHCETAFLWAVVVVLLLLGAGLSVALCLSMEKPILEES